MEIKKRTLKYLLIIIFLFVLIWLIKPNPPEKTPNVSEELAKCIGENSIYYAQTGCSACKIQEEMFGKYSKYLNKIDCKTKPQECNESGITATPTWFIKGQKYVGVQSAEKLKELTECNLN